MNSRQALDFWNAAAACDPAESYDLAAKLVAAVAEAAPAAEWEAAVRGGDASVLRLALLRVGAEGARSALARALSFDEAELSSEPAASRPWIDATWSAAAGSWTKVELATRARAGDRLRQIVPKPGPERTLATRRFSARSFKEPIAGALRNFHVLEPIASMQFEDGGSGWSLLLARPPAWPRFLRCDLAAAFAPRSAPLSLLLRDARVVALDFDGEAFWARCA